MSQDPSYILVAQEELQGIDIYGMLQKDDGIIWMTSNQGLLSYDGLEVKFYKHPEQTDNSLFGLRSAQPNEFYCFNLSGQIFKYAQDSFQLHYTLPDTLISSAMDIVPTKDGELFISGAHLVKLSKSKKLSIMKGEEKKTFGTSILINKAGELVYSGIGSGKVVFRKGDKTRMMDLSELLNQNAMGEFNVIGDANTYFVHPVTTFKLLQISGDSASYVPIDDSKLLKTDYPRQVYFTREGTIWFTLHSGGMRAFDLKGRQRYAGRKVFPQFSISAMLEDREGNLWFSTLGDGLLMIPEKSVLSFNRLAIREEEKIADIDVGRNGELFFATNKGAIAALDSSGTVVQIREAEIEPVDEFQIRHETGELFFSQRFDLYIVDIENGSIRNRQLLGTLKDITFIDDQNYLYATSAGVFFDGFQKSAVWDEINQIYPILELEGGYTKLSGSSRTRCLYYDRPNAQIFIGFASGLQIAKGGRSTELKWQGKTVVANEIKPFGGSIWISSDQHGVFEVQNGQLKLRIAADRETGKGKIQNMDFADDKLIVAYGDQVLIFDTKTGESRSIDRTDGLSSNLIKKVVVSGEKLWVNSGKSIQLLDWTKITQNEMAPDIRFTSFKVNDKELSRDGDMVFSYDQNNIEFNFFAPVFRHQGRLRYQYRLVGAGDDWQYLPFDQRSTRFTSLQSGDYKFEVRAINEDGVQSETLSHSFTILPPFWRRWWFLVLLVLAAGGVTFVFFRIRIENLKSKSKMEAEKNAIKQDLAESRLTALRSQMNPHFMFNALNSIQEYIVMNEKKLAEEYLGKFADLMRIYLDQGRTRTISLAEEIRAMKLYLELEQLRFEDSLSATVTIDSALLPDSIFIPSMIVQPYVENALKHGLLHKEGERILKVHFKGSEDGSMIHCIVEDNGIGREKAAEIRKMRNPDHQSFATSSTNRRLQLLNRGQDRPIGVNYEDLKNSAGESDGTLVTITIPVE